MWLKWHCELGAGLQKVTGIPTGKRPTTVPAEGRGVRSFEGIFWKLHAELRHVIKDSGAPQGQQWRGVIVTPGLERKWVLNWNQAIARDGESYWQVMGPWMEEHSYFLYPGSKGTRINALGDFPPTLLPPAITFHWSSPCPSIWG